MRFNTLSFVFFAATDESRCCELAFATFVDATPCPECALADMVQCYRAIATATTVFPWLCFSSCHVLRLSTKNYPPCLGGIAFTDGF